MERTFVSLTFESTFKILYRSVTIQPNKARFCIVLFISKNLTKQNVHFSAIFSPGGLLVTVCHLSWKKSGPLGPGGGGALIWPRQVRAAEQGGCLFLPERVNFVRLATQMLKISLIEMQNETSQGHKIRSYPICRFEGLGGAPLLKRPLSPSPLACVVDTLNRLHIPMVCNPPPLPLQN